MKRSPIEGGKTHTATAPGQVFLFGEHAVVYGQPALSTAIGIRTRVDAEVTNDTCFNVNSKGFGNLRGIIEKKGSSWKIKDKSGDVSKLSFVTKSVETVFNHLKEGRGLKIKINSDIPGGSGLGSSSAVTTATIAAVSSTLGERLSREKISQLAFDSEFEVQGTGSRTGVNAASHGGFLRIERDKVERLSNLSGLKIIIGYTGEYANTEKMVNNVRELKESRPEIIYPILKTIGKCTESGIDSLNKEDIGKVGVLMNANQNLLGGLKVSSTELDILIEAAKKAGAMGAKITGSGGGGCMIALGSDRIDEISKAIETAGGKPIEAKIGVEGVKY